MMTTWLARVVQGISAVLASLVGRGIMAGWGDTSLLISPDQFPDPEVDIAAGAGEQSVILAGGCFWCIEAVFAEVEGVLGLTSGYAGGSLGPMVEAVPSTETTPGTELPVLYVTSVEVMRTSMEPKLDIVRVIGLTGSQGWSAPQLVPTYVGKPLDGILDLQFIATMPDQTQSAEGFVPISAVFPLEAGHEFKGVRVRASATIQSARVSGCSSLAAAGTPSESRKVAEVMTAPCDGTITEFTKGSVGSR